MGNISISGQISILYNPYLKFLGQCNYILKNIQNHTLLQAHKAEKHKDMKLVDPYANRKVKRKFAPITRESAKSHKSGKSPQFRCNLCEYTITKKAKLENHLLTQHPDVYPSQDHLLDLQVVYIYIYIYILIFIFIY